MTASPARAARSASSSCASVAISPYQRLGGRRTDIEPIADAKALIHRLGQLACWPRPAASVPLLFAPKRWRSCMRDPSRVGFPESVDLPVKTAAKYDVDVNNLESSITGAAHYLADLYREQGSWTAALGAYSGQGPGLAA
jgi:hypothetical protein